jgi:hypothetical protein
MLAMKDITPSHLIRLFLAGVEGRCAAIRIPQLGGLWLRIIRQHSLRDVSILFCALDYLPGGRFVVRSFEFGGSRCYDRGR